jgi:monoamine oxidase
VNVNSGRESVIVLGGGVAGLSAALDLAATHSVTLLEAKERLGGRILTGRSSNGIPVEMGAEFIHGCEPHLMRLLKAAALQTHEVPDRHWTNSGAGLIELPDFWEQISSVTSEIKKINRDASFLTILQNSRKPRESVQLAKGFVEGFHGATVDKAGAKEIILSEEKAEELDGQKNFRVADGYDLLVRHMENECRKRGVRIYTGCKALTVDWKKRPATIHVDSRELSTMAADRVVITLPVGALRSGTIKFEPAPKEKLEAIHAIEPGSVTKVILHFQSRFWQPADFGFLHTTDDWFPTWWTDQRGEILTAWAGGQQAKDLSGHNSDFVVHRSIETASKLFGETVPLIRKELIGAYHHNWKQDPLTRGAYSFIPVGAVNAPTILARPELEILFFAGEATNLDHQLGTVHGAIQSGRRAARDILNCS